MAGSFDLARLLTTVFELHGGERFGVFTDLPDPSRAEGLAFLDDPDTEVQRHAVHTICEGVRDLEDELGHGGVELLVYRTTGGPNLDLPPDVWTTEGERRPLRQVLEGLDIVLYVSTWSATAPITALAREMGFRGATMHGINDVVLETGLSVDYEEVSSRAERLRSALEGADAMVLEFGVGGDDHRLELDLAGCATQKSHGLVREMGDVANLPAGEIYWVPKGAEGAFPQKFEDGTLAVMEVRERGVVGVADLVQGEPGTVEAFLARIEEDPPAGQITELGLGTQTLPFADAEIQDEKILGTAHVATGRSDHLGGEIDGTSFDRPENAAHHDILFTPNQTPEVTLHRVSMVKDGAETDVIRDYGPAPFIEKLL